MFNVRQDRYRFVSYFERLWKEFLEQKSLDLDCLTDCDITEISLCIMHSELRQPFSTNSCSISPAFIISSISWHLNSTSCYSYITRAVNKLELTITSAKLLKSHIILAILFNLSILRIAKDKRLRENVFRNPVALIN